ncbi:Pectin lyase fold/virulence factor [Penicillium paradoxum]|uniref:Pectin lyase fold/virulence factor n=1 Tax=Penicillium paradoxum TaxID=176176 RepID=UPI002547B8AC|nr:Pectin lyase fold/virulence factor [Penicillium paradoxum]KAJ5773644.1 Pectin lyase fold/virulence factor [Penicillium paradoxum]
MRGFSSLYALAAVASTASGAIVPIHLMRSSSSHGSSSSPVPTKSYDEFTFDWALASSLAGITGPPEGATIHQDVTSTIPSTISTTLATATKATTEVTGGLSKPATLSSTTSSKIEVISQTTSVLTQGLGSPRVSTLSWTNRPVITEAESSSRPTTGIQTKVPTSSASSTKSPIFQNIKSSVAKTCPAPGSQVPEVYWLDEQDHNEKGAGFAPYAKSSQYPVYRNVMDYSVVNDGSGDQTPKLQKAIDDDGVGGSRKGQGVTRYPAQVYLPGGVYQLQTTLKLTVGTIIVGNPLNPQF